jgi:hypothetical protein
MPRLRCSLTLGAACLLAGLPAVGTSGEPPTSAPFMFPTGESVYFFEDHVMGATLYEFKVDGTYREIAREHMFIAEMDAGRWMQRDDGELLKCSNHRYQELESHRLYIYMTTATKYERLPALREDITTLLRTRRSKRFPGKMLSRGEWPFPRSAGLLATDEKKVGRDDLQFIADEIPRYIERGEGNLFRSRPWSCGGCVYLFSARPAAGSDHPDERSSSAG